MPYHLIVSADANAFRGPYFEMPASRCLEHTDVNIREYFFRFGETRIDELLAYPAILAHESGVADAQVQLVRLREIIRRRDRVRVGFEPVISPFMTYDQFLENRFELDVDDFEYNRTHWAIKNIDLQEALTRMGIVLAASMQFPRPYVDLDTHAFSVALSFPGEDRTLVQDIASRLEQRLGVNHCFYDFHYQAFLARPGLDLLLQSIYRNARLNVVFLSSNYENKQWCSGVEFRVIRDMIANRENKRVMFIRTGEGDVAGVLSTDGWIDARQHSADNLAFFIEQRARAT